MSPLKWIISSPIFILYTAHFSMHFGMKALTFWTIAKYKWTFETNKRLKPKRSLRGLKINWVLTCVVGEKYIRHNVSSIPITICKWDLLCFYKKLKSVLHKYKNISLRRFHYRRFRHNGGFKLFNSAQHMMHNKHI